jgi:hypothetical protein
MIVNDLTRTTQTPRCVASSGYVRWNGLSSPPSRCAGLTVHPDGNALSGAHQTAPSLARTAFTVRSMMMRSLVNDQFST